MKKFFKFVLLLLVTGVLFVFHLSRTWDKEQTNEERFAPVLEAFSSAYKAYSVSSIKVANEKTLKCAEELYQKELAEGKTEDKFEGLTKVGYYLEAYNECVEQLTGTDRFALFLPLFFAVLVIIALSVSVKYGFSAIGRLQFNNDATTFDDKK